MTDKKDFHDAGRVTYISEVSEPSPAEKPSMESCKEPFTMVIMGATGDLASRKLIPSVYRLFAAGALPNCFSLIGCGRSEMSDEAFRNRISQVIEKTAGARTDEGEGFLSRISYRRVSFGGDEQEKRDYESLAAFLEQSDKLHGIENGNRLFYLALPPDRYIPAVSGLGEAGMARQRVEIGQWSRLVVEKPFGRDLKSARELNDRIGDYFAEHQIYRIDHYLAKETVQNILMFRFANAIFEPVWNRRYIDSVHVKALETLGVEHRAQYYEQAGVIRDMFQNHMMQLLSLLGMEPPPIFEAESIRDEKLKLYRTLRPFPVEKLKENIVLGQYEGGVLQGKAVKGYRDEDGVDPESNTPTYAKMKVFVDNWRWQGVPFYLESGKRLGEKRTEIIIDFKSVPHSLFRNLFDDEIHGNRLVLGIEPEERISLSFRAKAPGAGVVLRKVNMDFYYTTDFEGPFPDAYDRVLLDCMIGDQTLFWRQDGVEICWAFLSPILSACKSCKDPGRLLHFYPPGSTGPETSSILEESPETQCG